MCGPVAWGIAGGLAGAFQFYQSYQRSRTIDAVTDYNARMAQIRAAEVAARGREKAINIHQEANLKISRQKVQTAASGTLVGTGGAQALSEAVETISSQNAQQVLENYGERVDALQQKAEFIQQRGEAKSDATLLTGALSAVKTGLGVFQTGTNLFGKLHPDGPTGYPGRGGASSAGRSTVDPNFDPRGLPAGIGGPIRIA